MQPSRIDNVRIERTTSERNNGSPPVFQPIVFDWGTPTWTSVYSFAIATSSSVRQVKQRFKRSRRWSICQVNQLEICHRGCSTYVSDYFKFQLVRKIKQTRRDSRRCPIHRVHLGIGVKSGAQIVRLRSPDKTDCQLRSTSLELHWDQDMVWRTAIQGQHRKTNRTVKG